MRVPRVSRAAKRAGAAFNSIVLTMSFGLAPHIVGDSTAELATLEVGYGSGFPGRGFVSSAHVIYGGDTPYLNPLLPAPDGDVPVVGFVSIWDGLVTDFDGYVDATRQYPQGVIWVEVPPFSSDSRIVDPTLVELNARVADALGCDIIPWRWRDVDTKDGIHPSDAGVEELIMRMTVLAEFAEPCVIESTPPPGVR